MNEEETKRVKESVDIKDLKKQLREGKITLADYAAARLKDLGFKKGNLPKGWTRVIMKKQTPTMMGLKDGMWGIRDNPELAKNHH